VPEESKLLCFREESKGGVMFYEVKQTSRGREHLIDFERSEEIYLVTRDRFSLVHTIKKVVAIKLFPFLLKIWLKHFALQNVRLNIPKGCCKGGRKKKGKNAKKFFWVGFGLNSQYLNTLSILSAYPPNSINSTS
jgi:hypothetical protein